jgi:hypothetical protein
VDDKLQPLFSKPGIICWRSGDLGIQLDVSPRPVGRSAATPRSAARDISVANFIAQISRGAGPAPGPLAEDLESVATADARSWKVAEILGAVQKYFKVVVTKGISPATADLNDFLTESPTEGIEYACSVVALELTLRWDSSGPACRAAIRRSEV